MIEHNKPSARLMMFLMMVFSLVVYQFYSSSIVSGLLRPTELKIETVKQLEENGFDVGVENAEIFKIAIEVSTYFFYKQLQLA